MAVALRTSYPSLLHTAGFTDVTAVDLTDEYASTQRRWIAAFERHSLAIRRVIGEDEFDERIAVRHQTLRAIEDGVLSRFRYTAVR